MSSAQSLLKKLLQTENDEQNLLKLLLKSTKKGSGRSRKVRGLGRPRKACSSNRQRKVYGRGSYAKFGPRDLRGKLLPLRSLKKKRKVKRYCYCV